MIVSEVQSWYWEWRGTQVKESYHQYLDGLVVVPRECGTKRVCYDGDCGVLHDIKDDGHVSGLNCWMGDDTITKNGDI